ncbi:MAG: hypothetical protein PSV35_03180, partial [bacterium]|nr:hypothetical protein [bacterium]
TKVNILSSHDNSTKNTSLPDEKLAALQSANDELTNSLENSQTKVRTLEMQIKAHDPRVQKLEEQLQQATHKTTVLEDEKNALSNQANKLSTVEGKLQAVTKEKEELASQLAARSSIQGLAASAVTLINTQSTHSATSSIDAAKKIAKEELNKLIPSIGKDGELLKYYNDNMKKIDAANDSGSLQKISNQISNDVPVLQGLTDVISSIAKTLKDSWYMRESKVKADSILNALSNTPTDERIKFINNFQPNSESKNDEFTSCSELIGALTTQRSIFTSKVSTSMDTKSFKQFKDDVTKLKANASAPDAEPDVSANSQSKNRTK